jgi:hypothetical protein
VVSGLLSMIVVVVSGCGEDRADPGPATASCDAYCAAYLAAACTVPTYTAADECKATECGDIATSPSQCVAAFKTYYDCLAALAAADLCCDTAAAPAKQCMWPDVPCAPQYMALLTCSGR